MMSVRVNVRLYWLPHFWVISPNVRFKEHVLTHSTDHQIEYRKLYSFKKSRSTYNSNEIPLFTIRLKLTGSSNFTGFLGVD